MSMRYTAEHLGAELRKCYINHGLIVDDAVEHCIAERVGEVMSNARIFRGARFFYAIATGIEDAMNEKKLPKLSLIEELAHLYDAKAKSLEPTPRRAA